MNKWTNTLMYEIWQTYFLLFLKAMQRYKLALSYRNVCFISTCQIRMNQPAFHCRRRWFCSLWKDMRLKRCNHANAYHAKKYLEFVQCGLPRTSTQSFIGGIRERFHTAAYKAFDQNIRGKKHWPHQRSSLRVNSSCEQYKRFSSNRGKRWNILYSSGEYMYLIVSLDLQLEHWWLHKNKEYMGKTTPQMNAPSRFEVDRGMY